MKSGLGGWMDGWMEVQGFHVRGEEKEASG